VASEVRIPIRWRDVDAYGHVNNAVFLNYLEEARDRLVTDLFGEQDDVEAVVTCRVTGFGRSSVRTAEEVRKPDGTVAAEAESVVVARDPATGRSRPLTDDERAVLDRAVGTARA
jgi:acyl-CoA thioester hydrolase